MRPAERAWPRRPLRRRPLRHRPLRRRLLRRRPLRRLRSDLGRIGGLSLRFGRRTLHRRRPLHDRGRRLLGLCRREVHDSSRDCAQHRDDDCCGDVQPARVASLGSSLGLLLLVLAHASGPGVLAARAQRVVVPLPAATCRVPTRRGTCSADSKRSNLLTTGRVVVDMSIGMYATMRLSSGDLLPAAGPRDVANALGSVGLALADLGTAVTNDRQVARQPRVCLPRSASAEHDHAAQAEKRSGRANASASGWRSVQSQVQWWLG